MSRGFGSPRRKSSGGRLLASLHRAKASTRSIPQLQLTKGVPVTHNGSILNPVAELYFLFIHIMFSYSLCVGSFFDLCTVTADTSRVPKPKIKNPEGSHYEVGFEVALLFGLTELKAQLVWKEGGVEKRWARLPPLSNIC